VYNATVKSPRGFSFRPNKQSAIIMGALAGTILLLTGGLYFWQTSEIERIEKDVAAKQDEVHHGERIAKQLAIVRQDAAAVDGKLRFLEQNVSSGAYIPTMLQQMEKRASSFGLIATNSRHNIEVPPPPPPLSREDQKAGKKPPPPPPYNKARIEMDITGTYGNVARFIHSLTRFEKIIAVNSVMEQSKSEVTTSSPSLSVRIIMTGYVFPDSENVANAPQQPQKLGSLSERRAMENQLSSPPSPQPK
jgi:Tfp pilus assembly protein PilO